MGAYLLRRLMLLAPTLLGIIAINFAIVQFAPGGPVEQAVAEARGRGAEATARITGAARTTPAATAARAGSTPSRSRRSSACSASTSRPPSASWQMVGNYLRFDFGRSFSATTRS